MVAAARLLGAVSAVPHNRTEELMDLPLLADLRGGVDKK
jgi:hypothetical protein